jgi:phosphatidate cytidylyltransferase
LSPGRSSWNPEGPESDRPTDEPAPEGGYNLPPSYGHAAPSEEYSYLEYPYLEDQRGYQAHPWQAEYRGYTAMASGGEPPYGNPYGSARQHPYNDPPGAETPSSGWDDGSAWEEGTVYRAEEPAPCYGSGAWEAAGWETGAPVTHPADEAPHAAYRPETGPGLTHEPTPVEGLPSEGPSEGGGRADATVDAAGGRTPRRSRAGRNLPAAIGVGVALGTGVAASLFLNKILFVGVAVIALVFAIWELSQAMAAKDIRIPMVPVVAGAVAMIVGAFTGGAQALVVATALTVLGILVWRLPEGVDGYLRDATSGILAALYIPFLASFAIMMLGAEDGHRRVTAFILVTVCSDIGGYVAGVLFGRHPMAPSISPKKSWEGFTGSALACMAGGAAAVPLLLGGAWWQGAFVGLAVVLTATVGDLVESVIKRDLGVKDMGSLLPGHGGLMDRLDSLLVTAPIVWLLLSVLVPTG